MSLESKRLGLLEEIAIITQRGCKGTLEDDETAEMVKITCSLLAVGYSSSNKLAAAED
jgi:hypothetical protein